MNIKFDELLSEIDNVLQKKENLISPCQHNMLKDSSFSYIHATSCYNIAYQRITMINSNDN